jgi:phage-related protein
MKPVHWIGSSREDLKDFPKKVRREIGFALQAAQTGGKHASAKPLRGFAGAGVLEIVEDYRSETFRAVYTVRFAEAVYVLHCFKKKSKHGIKTPKNVIKLVESRLQRAQEDYQQWLKEKESGKQPPPAASP